MRARAVCSTPSSCISCSPGTASITSDVSTVLGSSLDCPAPLQHPSSAAASSFEDEAAYNRRGLAGGRQVAANVAPPAALTAPAAAEAAQFDAGKYLLQHKKALLQRQRVGPGRSHEMARLYSFWVSFLQDSYNEPMYNAFKRYAEEDAAAGHTHGLHCLFNFYLRYLMNQDFEADLYADFEALALKYQDYLGMDEGMDCLMRFLASVSGPSRLSGRLSGSNLVGGRHSNSGAPSSIDTSNARSASSSGEASGTDASSSCTNASSAPTSQQGSCTATLPPLLQFSPTTAPFLACSDGGGSGGGAIAAAVARSDSCRGGATGTPPRQPALYRNASAHVAAEDEDDEVADLLLLDAEEQEDELLDGTLGPQPQPSTSIKLPGGGDPHHLGARSADGSAGPQQPPSSSSARSSSTGASHTGGGSAVPRTTMVLVGPGDPSCRVEVDARVLQQLHAWQQQRGACEEPTGDLTPARWGSAEGGGANGSETSSETAAAAEPAGTALPRDPPSAGLAAPVAPGPGGRRASRRAGASRVAGAGASSRQLALALATPASAASVSALLTYHLWPADAGQPPSAPSQAPQRHGGPQPPPVSGASPMRGPQGAVGGKQQHGGAGSGGAGSGKAPQRSASASCRHKARALLADATAAIAGLAGLSTGRSQRALQQHAQQQQQHSCDPACQHCLALASGSPSPMAGSSPVVVSALAQHAAGAGRRALLRASLSVPTSQPRGAPHHVPSLACAAAGGLRAGAAAAGGPARVARSVRSSTVDGLGEGSSGVAEVPWAVQAVSKSGRVLVDDVSIWEAQPCGDGVAMALPLRLGELFGD